MEYHPNHHRFEGMENHHRFEEVPNHRNHRCEGMGYHPNPNQNHRCEEYHDILLSMNIHCCVDCPRVLEKKLRRMPEVDDVSIVDTDLIKVSGTFDPETLLKKVKDWGKRVKLVPMEELAKRKKHTQEKRPAARPVDKKEAVVKEPHNCDDTYEPPGVDKRVCRDFLCKLHPRSFPIYGNKLEDESFPFFGFSPFGGPSMIFSGYQQPPFDRYQQQLPYGYQQPPYQQYGPAQQFFFP